MCPAVRRCRNRWIVGLRACPRGSRTHQLSGERACARASPYPTGPAPATYYPRVSQFLLIKSRRRPRLRGRGCWINRRIAGGVTVQVAAPLLLIYTAPMNALFHTEPLDAATWARIATVTAIESRSPARSARLSMAVSSPRRRRRCPWSGSGEAGDHWARDGEQEDVGRHQGPEALLGCGCKTDDDDGELAAGDQRSHPRCPPHGPQVQSVPAINLPGAGNSRRIFAAETASLAGAGSGRSRPAAARI